MNGLVAFGSHALKQYMAPWNPCLSSLRTLRPQGSTTAFSRLDCHKSSFILFDLRCNFFRLDPDFDHATLGKLAGLDSLLRSRLAPFISLSISSAVRCFPINSIERVKHEIPRIRR